MLLSAPSPVWRLLLALAASSAFLASPACAANPATAPAAPAAAASAPYALFGGKPLEFERSGGKIVGVYTPNWQPAALVDALHGDSVTHIVYAFLHVCGPGQLPEDAPKCVGKGDFQLATSPIDDTFDAAFARLKARAPHVKVVASVGGWGGSDPFFHIADAAAPRATFAKSAAGFLRAHPAFDGIDIDWEHPTNNGAANGVQLGAPADGQGYADLMAALRSSLDTLTAENGHKYLVTAAINTDRALVGKVNYRDAAKSLDYIFMMTYDFYGSWTPGTGNHAALLASAPDAGDGLDVAVKTMTAAGVPAAKLVAGVAMYGRGFTGVAAPAAGHGFSGLPHTGTYPAPEGASDYRELAARYLDRNGRGRHGYQAILDPHTQSWNLYNAHSALFMGYDDPRAVLAKGAFVRQAGLAGVFAWELSQDNGDILNAMNAGVGNALLQP
ncbi:MAG: glycoside hydrolase family 18 protein [Caulobacter sp.]|nr:glycoside hydrolase family 18 protein [Vitreoscilla sp.]